MSRLAFGPKPKEMEVTDIATGHFVFRPVEGETVSYEALDGAIGDAGYEIERASIRVSGTVTENRHLETPDGQVFHLMATEAEVEDGLVELAPGTEVSVIGIWEVREEAEVIHVAEIDRRPERSSASNESKLE